MKSFGIVMILAICGYAIAYDTLTYHNEAEKGALTILDSFTHIYRMCFGDFETSEYDRVQMILFYFCSIFLALIMTNMLIAIMSDTFERISNS